MATSPTVARPVRPPAAAPSPTPRATEDPPVPAWLAFQRDEPPPAAVRKPWFLSRVASPLLVLATVVIGAVRQVSSSFPAASPLTDVEAAVGTNAFALQNHPDLSVPASFSDWVVSWQIAGYSLLSSAPSRHDSVVGPTREFVLVLTVVTLVLMVAICRRLLLTWVSSALAIAVAGIPSTAALARIIDASAAIALFWLVVAALASIVAADRLGRRRVDGTGSRSWRTDTGTGLLIALSLAASVLAVLTSTVAGLVVLGLALGFLGTRPLGDTWTPLVRGSVIVLLCTSLVGALWLSVLGPSAGGTATSATEVAGAVVGLGGLVLAAVCLPIAWLRPLAVAAVPILVVAAWPGPARSAALLMALTFVAVLAAGSLDTILGAGQSDFLTGRRFPASARFVGATVLVVSIVVAMLIPSTPPAAAAPLPDDEVAAWIGAQLLPDAIIEVDPLTRAQLVLDGVDANRLRTAGQGGEAAEFRLGPLDAMTELPLLASFGSGPAALGLRLVVSDPARFAEEQVADLLARSRFGGALAANPHLSLDATATAALLAGTVDSRLMISLATASASVRVAVAEFNLDAGAPANGYIFREVILVDVTDLDPTVGASGTSPEALGWLTQFFETQQPPYRPLYVIATDRSLTVGYAAPSPLGLLA